MNCQICAVLIFILGCVIESCAPASDISPSPFEDAHLIVIHPSAWSDAGGAPVKTKAIAVPALDQQAIVVGEPMTCNDSVRYAGSYTLWIRIGQTGVEPTPVHVEIMQGNSPVLQGDCNADEGHDQSGGPAGYRDYREKASHNKSHDALGDPELTERHGLPSPNAEKPDKVVEGLSDDLLNDVRAGTGERWINTSRVEKVAPELPFYWWKIGQAALQKGEYQLRVRPNGPVEAAAHPLVNVAILTTSRNLIYPYLGDLDAPRASYIRFRLDKLPADGLEISADINTHAGPYYRTPPFFMNPSGLNMKKSQRHTATGFTRWYCLQDVERAPALNGNEVTLHLMNPAAVASQGARGATQFAVFPQPDSVVRTIGWDEPDGLIISMQPDFETNQHLLRTIRDHAEEHYEAALAAAGGAPHPLTRGQTLSFSNSWGAALGDDYDYLVKTMRLLGFNSMGIRDPLKSRANYGGYTSLGSSWELSSLPFDENKTRKIYDDYYRNYFRNVDVELLKGVNVFQISDEPSEASREQMTAPLWRFERDEKDHGPDQWFDRSGDSDLNTRKTDLKDCVLEGTITKMSGWVGFRVGLDRAEAPTHYAYWHVGAVAPNNMPENLAVGKIGLPGAAAQPSYILRSSATIGTGPTPFKIIYEGTRAAFYLNGHLVHEHADLPPAGGFGLAGAAKSISRLQIRPIGKGEHLTADFQNGGELLGQDSKTPAAELDDPDKAPAAAVKPIKQFVDEDWIPAGGVPGANVGFRLWLAARGMTPQFFGATSWDSVRMLTVRELVRNEQEARLYFWSRRYSGYLTPRMFALAAEAVRANVPNKQMLSFVGLSGHTLYFPSQMPLDMFEMGNQGYPLMPGISDWMFYGGWRWDSFQVVAYSVAPFNSGARRWGPDGYSAAPASFPMMHCVSPNVLRAYTMLANQVKYISYFAYGPYYAVPADFWSESPECYEATSLTDNRAGGVDDILATAQMRPSRVALLYSLSTEYWDSQSSFADRRAAFLALSHEYYQPELVTEDQINSGALQHYDALYVMDPNVAAPVQDRIGKWVQGGGLLWASADAMVRDEYNQPFDSLSTLAGLRRTFPPAHAAAAKNKVAPVIAPVKDELDFRPHTVVAADMPESVTEDGARVRARYDNGAAAWLEKGVGKGKFIYLAHRAGLTYTAKASRPRGYPDIWAQTGRAMFTLPLVEAKVDRELTCSEPTIMASPLSTPDGTVIILYNMRPSRRNLVLTLKEPARPISVQAFVGYDLKDVPFTYAEGRASITLSGFDGGQMVLVRRKPAAADERSEELRQRTIKQLASTDWEALSAGAWSAGWHPEWKQADALISLLNNPRWQVRRSAAESLGRLAYLPALPALHSALSGEKDSNVLGEEVLAIAHLHDPDTCRLALQFLANDDPIVRKMAVRSALTSFESASAEGHSRDDALQIARLALADPNLRVRREGIALIFRLSPTTALEHAIAAFADHSPRSIQERSDWSANLSRNDPAFAEYVHQNLPGGDALLLSLAMTRADPALAAAIEKRLVELDSTSAGQVAAAAIEQGSPSLARRMFQERTRLRPETAACVPHVLEHAFDAQLGNVMEDWDRFLKDHADAPAAGR